jgi:hypothetical protein
VIAHDIARGRSIKMLGLGSAILFLGLGGTITLVDSSWSASQVKLRVDAGVLAISLLSLAIRRPFTLQYAREVVDTETAALPGFVKANYVITGAWTLAFLLMRLPPARCKIVSSRIHDWAQAARWAIPPAELPGFQNHSGFAKRSEETRRWPWTETGTSPCRRRWASATPRSR